MAGAGHRTDKTMQLISNYTHSASLEISTHIHRLRSPHKTTAPTASVHRDVEQSVAKLINRRRTFFPLPPSLPLSLPLCCHIWCRARHSFAMRTDEKCVSCCNISQIHPNVFIIFTPLDQCLVLALSIWCRQAAPCTGCVYIRDMLAYLSFYHPICWQLVERKRLHGTTRPIKQTTTTTKKRTHASRRHNKNIYSIKINSDILAEQRKEKDLR